MTPPTPYLAGVREALKDRHPLSATDVWLVEITPRAESDRPRTYTTLAEAIRFVETEVRTSRDAIAEAITSSEDAEAAASWEGLLISITRLANTAPSVAAELGRYSDRGPLRVVTPDQTEYTISVVPF